jgi:hypothetical protein
MELMRSIRWNMDCLPGSDNALLSAKNGLKLAIEKNEAFFEIMAMRRGSTSRGNMHVDETKPAGGISSG